MKFSLVGGEQFSEKHDLRIEVGYCSGFAASFECTTPSSCATLPSSSGVSVDIGFHRAIPPFRTGRDVNMIFLGGLFVLTSGECAVQKRNPGLASRIGPRRRGLISVFRFSF